MKLWQSVGLLFLKFAMGNVWFHLMLMNQKSSDVNRVSSSFSYNGEDEKFQKEHILEE